MGLYQKYQGRVQFVMIDIDHRLSPAKKELKEKSSGEVDDAVISNLLDKTLG